MCLDCGCHQPTNDHGDSRHITQQALKRAAAASGISPELAAKRIQAEIAGKPVPAKATAKPPTKKPKG